MKIFQLIHWLTKIFKLNNKAKAILLIVLPLPIFSQNNAAFWLGKRAGPTTVNVDYLVVAGGGGGGAFLGGGGGAGGYRSSVSGESSGGGASAETSLVLDINTNYQIIIGEGGVGGQRVNGAVILESTNGNNSVFASISSNGGGAGARFGLAPSIGGSGGGGSGRGGSGVAGTTNQGYAGGNGSGSGTTQNSGGGGGGGSGQLGQNAINLSKGGNGGNGVQSSITGVLTYYSGGGGGGYDTRTGGRNPGTGGLGGGGNGGYTYQPQNGTVNTGGGGGGGGPLDNENGGEGGSGVVIIRIPSTANNVLIGLGLQYKDSNGVTQNGNGTRVAPSYTPTGYKVYEFVGGTGNIQF